MTDTPILANYPNGLDPDDTSVIASAVQVNDYLKETWQYFKPLHSHRTGQLLLATEGVVGLQLEDRQICIPAQCAVWVPPGVMHTTIMSLTGKMTFMHVGPQHIAGMPDKVVRMIPNPMTVEMILFAAKVADRPAEHLTRIQLTIIEELRYANKLPEDFAPLATDSRILTKILLELTLPGRCGWTVAQWSERFGISERTLSRHALQHTGLSFRKWILQHLMLYSLSLLTSCSSIDEVAEICGYQNTSSFIIIFKQVFGVTPGVYKNYLKTR